MTDDDVTPEGPQAHRIPPVRDRVESGDLRGEFAHDPGFLASETALLRRNGVDTSRVLLSTYGRDGAAVSMDLMTLGEDGKPIIEHDGFGIPTHVHSEHVDLVLAVYP